MEPKQTNAAAWAEQEDCLYKRFQFADFSEAFAFMTRVAMLAERLDHHPRWTNEYNRLECWLSTHSAGNKVTDKDRDMATQIDRLVYKANG